MLLEPQPVAHFSPQLSGLLQDKYFVHLFSGSPLPMAMHRASSVQLDNTFVLVGGYSRANEGHLDTVLAYNSEGGSWEKLQSMSRKRASATAMLTDAEVFHEC